MYLYKMKKLPSQIIEELGLKLPPAPKPAGVYKPILIVGKSLYVSGQGPVNLDGSLMLGRVGDDINEDQGKLAAKQVGLTMLSTIQTHYGSLDNIERVVKKAETGQSSNLEEIRYEGYASSGIALIIDAVTDNRNRTAAEVRSSFTKYGGTLGETGSVSFMFNNIGQIIYNKNIKSDEDIFEIAVDVGADDVNSDENNHEIFTSVNEFNNVREKLEKLLGMPEQAQIIWQPENFIKIDDEKKAISILKLLETLDNCEDVQGIYSNFDIKDEIINKFNI